MRGLSDCGEVVVVEEQSTVGWGEGGVRGYVKSAANAAMADFALTVDTDSIETLRVYVHHAVAVLGAAVCVVQEELARGLAAEQNFTKARGAGVQVDTNPYS